MPGFLEPERDVGMRDDRRMEGVTRVRPQTASTKSQSARPAAKNAAQRPAAGARIQGPQQPRARREAEYLYPDDAYYKKASAGKGRTSNAKGPASKRGKKGKKRRENPMRVLFYVAFAVVMALLISFLVRTFLFEIVRVSQDAMYDSLIDGDWVIVTKFDYWSDSPARGDIVAVNVSGQQDGVILRRVVGLPGETLSVDFNGDTLINGNPIGENYVTLRLYEELPEVTLPGGRFFVMSDNRTVKLDSRDPSIDVVRKSNIMGKARAILWPLSRSGQL